jgi:hypothetical protein
VEKRTGRTVESRPHLRGKGKRLAGCVKGTEMATGGLTIEPATLPDGQRRMAHLYGRVQTYSSQDSEYRMKYTLYTESKWWC